RLAVLRHLAGGKLRGAPEGYGMPPFGPEYVVREGAGDDQLRMEIDTDLFEASAGGGVLRAFAVLQLAADAPPPSLAVGPAAQDKEGLVASHKEERDSDARPFTLHDAP